MSANINSSKRTIAYEDEAVKTELTKILCDKYNRNLRITNFVREDIREPGRNIVSRLYIQLDDCDRMTVIIKQINPDWLINVRNVSGEDFIEVSEALGRIMSGKRIAPELYGAVSNSKKRRIWLFMEDLGKNLITGREDFENEDMRHCLGFIEKVARIHLLFAEQKEENLLKTLQPLILEPRTHKGCRDKYESAIEKSPDNIETIIQTGKFSWLNEMETPFMDILKPCLDIIDRIVSQPFVFGHWDMAPEENLVIGREGEEPIYYFIDWDEIYFGPALDNLPIIRFDETEELALVERYWECVRGSAFVPSEKDECFLMYNYCRLMRYICDVYSLSKRLIQTQFGDIGAAERIRQSISNAITLAKKLQIIPSY